MRRRPWVFRAEQLIDRGGVCLAALQGGQTDREGVSGRRSTTRAELKKVGTAAALSCREA